MFVVLTNLPITATKSAERAKRLGLVLPLSSALYRAACIHRILSHGREVGIVKTIEARPKAENILLAVFLVIGLVTLLRFAFLG